jgi:hypothetical protein
MEYSGPVIYKDKELTKSECEELCWRCQTDLFFLTTEMLGYTEVTEFTHRQVAEFFVKKDPRLPWDVQDTVKWRELLFPRFGFKSTFNVADAIQWFLCFCDIAVSVFTGEKELAYSFVDEAQDHFVCEEPETTLQQLFPHYCITPKQKRTGRYIAPCRNRTTRRDPTLYASSIASAKSGWHPDIIKLDDAVNDINTETESSTRQTNKNIRMARKTLHPRGYFEDIGTPYSPLDFHAEMLKMKKQKPGKIKVLFKPAWEVKPEARGKAIEEFTEDDVVLLFPEKLSFEFLMHEYLDDPEGFLTQYLLNPHGNKEVIFEPGKMAQATLPATDVPVNGQMFMAWRLSYSGKDFMKYTAGAVGMLVGYKMFIVDSFYGKPKPSELAYKIVDMARKHGITQVSIEDSPGAHTIESEVKNYSAAMEWPLTIHWTEFEEDDGAREHRIKSLEPLVTSMRLLFSAAVPFQKQMQEQFEDFMFMLDNSLPDVISRLAERMPRLLLTEVSQEQKDAWDLIKERDHHDRIFGRGKYEVKEPEVEPLPEPEPPNPFGLEEIMPGLNG